MGATDSVRGVTARSIKVDHYRNLISLF